MGNTSNFACRPRGMPREILRRINNIKAYKRKTKYNVILTHGNKFKFSAGFASVGWGPYFIQMWDWNPGPRNSDPYYLSLDFLLLRDNPLWM